MAKQFFAVLVFIILLSTSLAQEPLESSQEPSTPCPIDLPERPALDQHVEHTEMVAGAMNFEDIMAHGEDLFTVVFNRCDGQGRPATTGTGVHREADEPTAHRLSGPDANSCAGCHNQPRVGGAGDFVANVFVMGQAFDPVLDTISPEFSNSRNTTGMFGTGAIELLAREMTADLHRIRDEAIAKAMETGELVAASLDTKGVNFGVIVAYSSGAVEYAGVRGVDADLIIRPFHQAGVVVSLREFTVNAMNHHHGMQAEERFDLNPRKGNPDYDEDGIERELTIGDITALTIWQAALGTPSRVMPDDPEILASAELGEQHFADIGCTSCHIPEMVLESCIFMEPNPNNPEGTFSNVNQPLYVDLCTEGETPRLESRGDGGAIVRAYTDLKRHNLCDDPAMPDAIRFYCDELVDQNRPAQDGRPGAEFFITRRLWDVGNTAPYGHRGNLSTIAEAIMMHGGEARAQRDAFVALPYDDQLAIVDFLYTLQVVPTETD